MMQFPIINQPQVAILSTDAVKRKPVVVEDSFGNESIVVHSVGVLAMAWDHRAIDGAYAAAFLAAESGARVEQETDTGDGLVLAATPGVFGPLRALIVG